uniref:Protein S100 n=2 Tax=Ursus americanus TaxID=9643 RepID=A0A452QG52_URSAM
MVQARTKPLLGVMSIPPVFTLLGAEAPPPSWDFQCAPCSRWNRSLGTMLTELESAMNSLIDVYHKYSLEKGNYHALYRDDLKKLLETECPRYMKKKDADTWFKELDVNSDGAINFEEFLILVIKVGVATHEDIHKE